jgi:hypothetical protein
VTLHLGRLQFAQLSGSYNTSSWQQQQEAEESSVLLTIGSIGIDQTAAQPWQQFQQRYQCCGSGSGIQCFCTPLDPK